MVPPFLQVHKHSNEQRSLCYVSSSARHCEISC